MGWRTKHDSDHEYTNVDIGDTVSLVDIGGGVPGLPVLDGSQLTNLPPTTAVPESYFASDESSSTTDSESLSTKLALTFTPNGGIYKIEYYCEMSSEDDEPSRLKVMIDSTVITDAEPTPSPEDDNTHTPYSGFRILSLPPITQQTVTIQWAAGDDKDTDIRAARLLVTRIQ